MYFKAIHVWHLLLVHHKHHYLDVQTCKSISPIPNLPPIDTRLLYEVRTADHTESSSRKTEMRTIAKQIHIKWNIYESIMGRIKTSHLIWITVNLFIAFQLHILEFIHNAFEFHFDRYLIDHTLYLCFTFSIQLYNYLDIQVTTLATHHIINFVFVITSIFWSA